MSEDKRQLKIKTGAVRRTQKELGYYAKERDREQARVDSMRASHAEEHDLKQAVRS
jgi:tubulin-specific chaperone A